MITQTIEVIEPRYWAAGKLTKYFLRVHGEKHRDSFMFGGQHVSACRVGQVDMVSPDNMTRSFAAALVVFFQGHEVGRRAGFKEGHETGELVGHISGHNEALRNFDQGLLKKG